MRTIILAAALILLACRGAPAQVPGAPAHAAARWSDEVGCTIKSDTATLRVTLPVEVLDHLERMQGSTFVHAFLIRYISDDEAGRHRLSLCARAFADAELTDFGALRQNLPDAQAIIDALRTAEQARLRTVQLTDSARALPTVVARLQADLSPASLELFGEQLAAADRFCGTDTRGACGTLDRVMAQLTSLREARAAFQAAGERARHAAAEAERAAADAQAAAASLAADTLSLTQLLAAGSGADTAAVRALRGRIERWVHVRDSLTTVRDSVVGTTTLAAGLRDRAARVADEAQQELQTALTDLESRLQDAAGRLAGHTVAALQGTRIGAAVSAIAAPPAPSASGNPSVRSANILLELTDFIIGRMRREAVNSFIVNLHGLARNEPLLQAGFPETWALMQGLSTRVQDHRLNAVDVGRIPLTAWRATLAGDFVRLPVNLLDAGPVAICRGGPSGADSLARNACRQRVAGLAPLVPMALRLLEGDAVFDVLRDAGSFTAPQGPDLPPEWRRVSQGLTVLATLAETYLAQGYAPAADPARHPYVLTGQSLVQVPQRQRNAFVRLLLVRAVPSAADVPATIDPAALQNATAGITRLLERIAARPLPADARPADAGLVLRSAFDGLVSAVEVARVLAPAAASARLDTLRTRWRAVSGALESITARDFGLALSRTTVLLRDLRGVEVPGAMVTLAALASSLSEAQDGAQMQAAFEAAASPVGGWQGKRYGEGGGSITAFPGMATGFEQVIREGNDPAGVDEPAFTLGASLPIGLEWQFRLGGSGGTSAPRCRLLVCGVGVFMPLIDLGALLSYRVSGTDSVESEPNANVRQVFAPGAYLSLALTRTVPVNLLVGGQLMPSLRSVSGTESSGRRSAFRYGIGIGMDILLLDF